MEIKSTTFGLQHWTDTYLLEFNTGMTLEGVTESTSYILKSLLKQFQHKFISFAWHYKNVLLLSTTL